MWQWKFSLFPPFDNPANFEAETYIKCSRAAGVYVGGGEVEGGRGNIRQGKNQKKNDAEICLNELFSRVRQFKFLSSPSFNATCILKCFMGVDLHGPCVIHLSRQPPSFPSINHSLLDRSVTSVIFISIVCLFLLVRGRGKVSPGAPP